MSDACLVFINAMATEGWDRDGLHDDYSDSLVQNVASRCARTTVVIHAAGVRLVDRWIDHPNVTAAIIAHLPGQDAGGALVDILYGDACPSGRLPYTLPRNESDYGHLYGPCLPVPSGDNGGDNDDDDDRDVQCDYSEGVYVDYRRFDAEGIEPRFEFGFGLSYTSFGYGPATVRSLEVLTTGGRSSSSQQEQQQQQQQQQNVMPTSSIWDNVASVSFRLTNTGTVEGQETAQLYVGVPGGPARQLRGFEKVGLRPRESAEVTFELTGRDLSTWDVVSQRWVVQRGRYDFYVGSSSRDIRWNGTYTWP